jgi:hypothetical protein
MFSTTNKNSHAVQKQYLLPFQVIIYFNRKAREKKLSRRRRITKRNTYTGGDQVPFIILFNNQNEAVRYRQDQQLD